MARTTLTAWILTTLLLMALVALGFVYDKASRPLYEEGDRPLIERARQGQAAAFSAERWRLAKDTFPIVVHLSDRTCVELRAKGRDPSGTYLACYDDRTGVLIEERASVT